MRIYSFRFVFLICALVCFLLAAFNVPAKVSWVPLGYAFIVAAFISPT